MRLAATLLFSATALIVQVAASARPRVPITLLRPSQSYVITGSDNDFVSRANGCPVGWAVCSSITCYPLDGSECCSDGNFCPAGSVCDSGGCCPFGEICDGSAPPPITVGSGNVPTDTDTKFDPLPTTTTTRRATTTSTRPATPTSAQTSTDPFTDPLGITAFSVTPDVSVTVTTPTSFLAAGTEPGEDPLPTTAGVPQLPIGGTGGAAPAARGGWVGVLLAGVFILLVNFV
ncbi:hypothetical protein VTO73DRAFT_11796 [Trametes versicolor]